MVHTFLRSVGFRDVKQNKELYSILEDVINEPDAHNAGRDSYGNEFVSFSKYYGEDYGITVCGNFIREHEFRMEYYYPFLIGSSVSTCEPVEIEQHASKQAYAGICDELKLGVALIFYINNEVDVMRNQSLGSSHANNDNVVLSALSTNGKVLLPLNKDERQVMARKEQSQNRLKLMQQARDGDTKAMEHLTAHDMDVYSSLYRRIQHEDILSIVESSFIPYGIESDQYVVVGDIISCYQEENAHTGEKLWILNLECNHLCFDVIINEKDLLGEPKAGRRFRGRVWLQGHLNYGY